MSTESKTKSAGVPAGATLRDILEDVSGHLRIESVDTEGGWQCVECGQPQPELQHEIRHAEGCSVGAFEDLLAKLAEAGPAPTTAAPAEQPPGGVVDPVTCPGRPEPHERGYLCDESAAPAEQLSGKVAGVEYGAARRGGKEAAMHEAVRAQAENPAATIAVATVPRPAQPQAPAGPTQEQIEKATAVVANLWGPKSLHVALVGKIAAALAAEAAPLREERDRLARELAEAREDLRAVEAIEEERPRVQADAVQLSMRATRRAEAADAKVAERDARIARVRTELKSAADKNSVLFTRIASALGAPEGQPPAPPQELLGKEGADALRQALRDLREVQEHGSLDEEAGAALNGVEHRLLKLLPAGEPWPIPAPSSPEEQLSGKELK